MARVAALLQRLNEDADAATIERLADDITGHMLFLVASRRSRGFDIGADEESGHYARPRSSSAGLARELRDIDASCRKAISGKISWQHWVTDWTALPERTKTRLWKPLLKQSKERRVVGGDVQTHNVRTIDRRNVKLLGFATSGFHTLAPKPQDVRTAIKAELFKITARPEAKERRVDLDAKAAREAIRRAYQRLTGHRGGRVLGRNGQPAGKLVELGRAIDATFGTHLFPARRDTESSATKLYCTTSLLPRRDIC
jgi:hypothetical protein